MAEDLTFKEIYERNGVILNIGVSDGRFQLQNRLLNYVTAPNMLVWSACVASCSVPEVFGFQELFMKT